MDVALTIPAPVLGLSGPPADFPPQDACRTILLVPRWCHSNVPSGPLAEIVSVFDRLCELSQLAVLEMEDFVRVQQARVWQCIADRRKVVTPNTSSLLSLKEGRIHEEMPAEYRDVVFSEPFHKVDTAMVMAVISSVKMLAELIGIQERLLFEGRRAGRRRIQKDH